MDIFYEFFYSCGLMSRPSRCWSDHIGSLTVTIICAVGFGYILSKLYHTGYFSSRTNVEGARELLMYDEPAPRIIGPDHRRSSIIGRIFDVFSGFMLAMSGGVMKIKKNLTSGINNEKPEDRVMIQEDGPESIGSRVRSSHRSRRSPAISNETSHARFLNQEEEPIFIESGERHRRRPRRSGRSR